MDRRRAEFFVFSPTSSKMRRRDFAVKSAFIPERLQGMHLPLGYVNGLSEYPKKRLASRKSRNDVPDFETI
jgi:hypothetical protein